ncbi:interleukin-15 receptor subunit alpha isoform X1 [Pleurodeles waltl]
MAWREALCALMTFLHLVALCAATAEARTECHVPEQIQHTQPFPHEMFPSREGTSLRYKCQAGYKRKAGTSNLIVCKADAGEGTARWTRPEVECIRDPSLPPPPATFTTKRTTSSTAPEAHSTTYQDFGTHATTEADIMSSEIPTTRILTSSTCTASSEKTSEFRVPEHFSTTIVPSERSSTGTAALEETSLTHTSHHDTSAVEGMTDQFWNKHTQIGGGVTAVLVLIVLSGIAMFMTWKKRNQRHTPKTITENSSIPMMSQAATKERVDSNLMEEQNTEHVEEGT